MAKRKISKLGIDDALFDFVPSKNGENANSHGAYSDFIKDQSDITAYKTAKEEGTLRFVNIAKLKDDEDNRRIYGEYYTDGLMGSMKEYGFQGAIRAYPNGDGTYTIESGHRSKEAAKRAGINDVPVIVTEPPKDDVERRKRLVLANLHGRKYTPMIIAREITFLSETYEKEALETSGTPIPKNAVNDRIAKDLEISKSQVSRYRQLNDLIPELQELADSEQYSWSALIEAASLAPVLQQRLYSRILQQKRFSGQDSVTREWIKSEIDEFRYIKPDGMTSLSFDPHDLEEETFGETRGAEKKRKRRTDGTKAVMKSLTLLQNGLGDNGMIKKKARETTLEGLREIRSLVDAKIAELER